MTTATRLRIAASFIVLCIGSLVMLLVAIPTLFLARRFYSEVIGRAIGRAVLALWGIRFRVHHLVPPSTRQLVYLSNHTSTLDVFLLIAMALPRARFFLSGFLRKLVPLGIIGTLLRFFWTVPQAFPERRRQIFARAARILAATGDSVYLSPEGGRITTGEIGPFNKGAFHLATSLGAPIVPIYFRIPADMDPGLGMDARAGVVDLYLLPPIETKQWRVEDVPRNRDRVHALFVRVHAHIRATGHLPADLSLDGEAPATYAPTSAPATTVAGGAR